MWTSLALGSMWNLCSPCSAPLWAPIYGTNICFANWTWHMDVGHNCTSVYHVFLWYCDMYVFSICLARLEQPVCYVCVDCKLAAFDLKLSSLWFHCSKIYQWNSLCSCSTGMIIVSLARANMRALKYWPGCTYICVMSVGFMRTHKADVCEARRNYSFVMYI